MIGGCNSLRRAMVEPSDRKCCLNPPLIADTFRDHCWFLPWGADAGARVPLAGSRRIRDASSRQIGSCLGCSHTVAARVVQVRNPAGLTYEYERAAYDYLVNRNVAAQRRRQGLEP